MKRAVILAVLWCSAAFGQYAGGVSGTGLRARATSTVSQAIPTGTNTPLLFDTNVYDTGSMHSTTVQTSRFTVPAGQGGVWLAWGQVIWANVATAQQRGVGVAVNGAMNTQDIQMFFFGATFTAIFPIFDVLVLNAGDYVEFICFQNTGSNMNATATSFGAIVKLGPS